MAREGFVKFLENGALKQEEQGEKSNQKRKARTERERCNRISDSHHS